MPRLHDSCEPILDAEGDPIGQVSSNTERGTLLYEVTLLGPEGGAPQLHGDELHRGEAGLRGTPRAEVPPLTLEQLRALAEDPVWTSYEP